MNGRQQPTPPKPMPPAPKSMGFSGEGGLSEFTPVRYFFIFMIFFILLFLMELRVEKGTEYGLQRLDRLYQGNQLNAESRDQSPREIAERFDVNPQQVGVAQYLINAHMDELQEEANKSWSRLFVYVNGDDTYYVGPMIILDFLLAMLVPAALYLRKRQERAEELFRCQEASFERVNTELHTRMTESTRIIEKFNRLQDKLVEAEKMASIGRLSATLAHEIRNPLSIIKSATEIIEDELENGSAGEAGLTLVRDEIDRLDRIITDMLNFARPKRPNLERLWIKELVRHWIPPVVEELEKEKVQIVPQLEVDGEVVIDPDQLYQIFLNTVWNARDALRGNHNPHVFIRLSDGGDYVVLTIQDTGMGMLPEVLKQMREPFFTTKTQGSGLGVPVSIQLIEGMNGKYKAESILEEGTSVSLWLPRPTLAPKLVSDSGIIMPDHPSHPFSKR